MKKIFPILLLAAPALCGAAPAVVQSAIGAYADDASTAAESLTALPSSVNAVIAVLNEQDQGYSTTGCASVADNQSHSFTKVVGTSHSGLSNVEVWWLSTAGTTSGTYTVTCTANVANSIKGRLTVIEVSGISAVDISAQSSNGSTKTVTLTAGSANTNAGDFELSGISASYDSGSATSVPTGFTAITNAYYNSQAPSAITIAYKVASAIETMTATWTWTTSVDSGQALVSFLPSGGSSCTHAGFTSGGASSVPNGTSGSYWGKSGAFVTPDCSSVQYWQAGGAFGVN